MQEVKDAKILEMLSNDSQFDKGFELLVQKYQERLYWHIRNYVHFHQDADDIIQNTFIKVFKNFFIRVTRNHVTTNVIDIVVII